MTHWRQRNLDAAVKLSRDTIFFAVGILVGAIVTFGVLHP